MTGALFTLSVVCKTPLIVNKCWLFKYLLASRLQNIVETLQGNFIIYLTLYVCGSKRKHLHAYKCKYHFWGEKQESYMLSVSLMLFLIVHALSYFISPEKVVLQKWNVITGHSQLYIWDKLKKLKSDTLHENLFH